MASSGAEDAISAETASAATSAAPALLGVLPMGSDLDSAMFAAALIANGSQYLGVVSEHAAQRGMFAGTQALAADVSLATEALRAGSMAL